MTALVVVVVAAEAAATMTGPEARDAAPVAAAVVVAGARVGTAAGKKTMRENPRTKDHPSSDLQFTNWDGYVGRFWTDDEMNITDGWPLRDAITKTS